MFLLWIMEERKVKLNQKRPQDLLTGLSTITIIFSCILKKQYFQDLPSCWFFRKKWILQFTNESCRVLNRIHEAIWKWWFLQKEHQNSKIQYPSHQIPKENSKRSLRSEKDVVQKNRTFVGPEVMGKGIKENSKSRGLWLSCNV